MAEWCLANVDRVAGKKVVELGSGSGLVGLTCWKKCDPASVILTDFHPKVLETLLHNIESNLSKEGALSSLHENGTHFQVGNKLISIESLDWIAYSEGNSDNYDIEGDIILASGKFRVTSTVLLNIGSGQFFFKFNFNFVCKMWCTIEI